MNNFRHTFENDCIIFYSNDHNYICFGDVEYNNKIDKYALYIYINKRSSCGSFASLDLIKYIEQNIGKLIFSRHDSCYHFELYNESLIRFL